MCYQDKERVCSDIRAKLFISPNYTGQHSSKGIQGKPIELRNLQHENVEKTQLSSTSFDTMLLLLINN
jgi:hypothetical protein